MIFDDLIAPLPVNAFVQRYLGQEFLLTHTDARCCAELVTWDELGDILSNLRVTGNRLGLVKNGMNLSPATYLQFPDATEGSRIRVPIVARLLAEGTTLILNHVDELARNVRALAASCEDVFQTPIGVNLYASWKTEPGFHLHWDSHDVFVAQIVGRKHWTVYRPTTLHPIDRDDSVPRPVEAPIWEGHLVAGDVLYMPRGWWHVARPVDEASVHLSIGVTGHTGADLLRWLVKRLHKHVEVRTDIPHLGTREEKERFATELRNVIANAISRDVIDRYIAGLESKEPHRLTLRLPEAVQGRSVSVEKATAVRLTGTYKLHMTGGVDGKVVRFRINGSDWECDRRLVPALELLDARRAIEMQRMVDTTPPEAIGVLKGFLTALAYARVIGLEGEAPPAT